MSRESARTRLPSLQRGAAIAFDREPRRFALCDRADRDLLKGMAQRLGMRAALTHAAIALLVACDSSGTDASLPDASDASIDGANNLDSSADAFGAVDSPGASDAGEAPDAAPNTPCPPSPPQAGATCEKVGLWCQYGSDPHGRCATRAYCNVTLETGALHWDLLPADPNCGSAGTACPSSFTPDAGPCPLGAGAHSCDFAEGRCACVNCDPADGGAERAEWTCRAWSDVATMELDDGGGLVEVPHPGECPPIAPRLGTYCTDTKVICGYDSCGGVSLGWYEWCSDGTWAVGPQTDLCNLPVCASP